MEFIVLLLVMVALFWFMSRSAKKQRENVAVKQKQAAVPGTWVITIGGFLGKVVAVDGDVVTLESPSGVETIWSMQAIREAHQPNFGTVTEDDDLVVDVTPAAEPAGTGPVAGSHNALDPDALDPDAPRPDAFDSDVIDPDDPRRTGR